ncbi:MAG: SpoIIE family protein phosphatase, partial [Chloroflexi bacterium]|nr:SpoIIE family protein phosphatase [Chloroflexota bacterium]
TDGITEAKNPSEDFYGDERLAERVTQQWPSALSAAKQVEADVFAHIEDHQQTDDVTLIALRRRVESEVERHTLVQEATLRNLPRLRQFAAESAQRLGASDALASVLKLIVDEIGTNVINYGYEGDATGEIRLKIWENGRGFTIQFEDEGQPFNPLTHPKPELEDDLDTRQTGGLGLYFVRELSDRLIYETDGIINRLTLQVGSDYLS